MITRVVKLTLRPERVEEFVEIFGKSQPKILNQPGCISVRLMKDIGPPCELYTFSEWSQAEDLERYRRSALFGQVWPVVKKMFAAPAVAWSLSTITDMPSDAQPSPTDI